MNTSDLILVGIAVAQRWPEIDLKRVKIGTVPKGTMEWKVVLYTPLDREISYFHSETIQLEHFREVDGEIWIGYGSQSGHLVFWIP